MLFFATDRHVCTTLCFIQSYPVPALLGTHSRASVTAQSLLEVTDLVSLQHY